MPSLNLLQASTSIEVSAPDTQADLADDISKDMVPSHNDMSTLSNSSATRKYIVPLEKVICYRTYKIITVIPLLLMFMNLKHLEKPKVIPTCKKQCKRNL